MLVILDRGYCMVFLVIGVVLGYMLRWPLSIAMTAVKSLRFSPADIWLYIKHRKWRLWDGFGLRIYVGMFGTGKSLSAVRYVRSQAMRYHLNVISNIVLKDIEYTPLINYKQIIDAPPNTIILIDEVSTVFNARSWKDFNVNLLFQLLQCRKNRKQLVCTAQRFAHVDKLLRDITAEVVVCRKNYRICRNYAYDGWDYENTPAQFAIAPLWRYCYVATNRLYAAYDTDEIIDNVKKTDFLSNDEILAGRMPGQIVPENLTRKGKKLVFKR